MKKTFVLFLVLMFCLLIGGCTEEKKQDHEMYVYYINADGNALLQEIYPKTNIGDALKHLSSHAVFTKGVEVVEYGTVSSKVTLYFNEKYDELSKSEEVLMRAAVVQTMVQLDGVDFVEFYIGEQPLKDSKGNTIGLMSAQDFVQNTGSSIDSYQTTNLNLYFADKDGKQLKATKKTNIRYNANTAIERLVVEQLMKGTSASGSQSVIPTTAKLLGVSVKDGICYVNFDSKFATDSYDLDPEIVIYSIVNSIIDNSNVTKVQILIEGVNDNLYRNSVDLSIPLERKADLLKE